MKTWSNRFNIYLLAALLGLTGCESQNELKSDERDPKKQFTLLRLHLEASPEPGRPPHEVPVFRSRPVLVSIEDNSFLSEQDVVKAELVDEPGGFSIKIEFDRHGRNELERVTGSNRQRHIAIFARFGPVRWLAAPVIREIVRDGKLVFTPDATREEADRIIRGLNNVARKMAHDPRF